MYNITYICIYIYFKIYFPCTGFCFIDVCSFLQLQRLWLLFVAFRELFFVFHCGGFPCCRVQAQQFVAYRLIYPTAYGIFSNQGSNRYPLHWQADSEPLDHQEKSQFIYIHIYMFIFLRHRGIFKHFLGGLCWLSVFVGWLFLAVASRSYSLVENAGFSLWWPLSLQGMGSRAHRLQ